MSLSLIFCDDNELFLPKKHDTSGISSDATVMLCIQSQTYQ